VALRYANVVGPRATRGVIKDFILKLKANPRELEILGDGTQTKSYIWIDDAVDATILAWEKTKEGFEPYNVGSIDAISVKEVADIVVEVMGLRDVSYRFTGGVMGGRGWVGDVKYMHLDIAKLQRMGWSPKYSSREAVRKAAMSLVREIGTK
jgi:UDP-glucose 4-epimerase